LRCRQERGELPCLSHRVNVGGLRAAGRLMIEGADSGAPRSTRSEWLLGSGNVLLE